MKRVLVGCEFSGAVRNAFRERGFDAWSNDVLPAEDNSPYHIAADVFDALTQPWDLAIFHPPCTYLCSSGLHWNKRVAGRQELTEESLLFVQRLLDADVARIALENPVGCISSRIRKPDQIIQPWQFGHPESKSTCLWLKNLPRLVPTNVLSKPENGRWNNQTPSGQNKLGPSENRWAERSRTYAGIAAAMAEQWGQALNREGTRMSRLDDITRATDNLDRCVRERGKHEAQGDRWGLTLGEMDWLQELHRLLYEETT